MSDFWWIVVSRGAKKPPEPDAVEEPPSPPPVSDLDLSLTDPLELNEAIRLVVTEMMTNEGDSPYARTLQRYDLLLVMGGIVALLDGFLETVPGGSSKEHWRRICARLAAKF